MVTIVAFVILVSIPLGTESHTPSFPSSPSSLSGPYNIENPADSQVLYNHLEENSAHYYHLRLDNQRLFLQILVPTQEAEDGFMPQLLLMIPDWGSEPLIPAHVEFLPGYGGEVISSSLPSSIDYEGITATTHYVVMSFDENSNELYEGLEDFYLAIYDSDGKSGNYALAVGYEEVFSPADPFLFPFYLLKIYLWQGSSIVTLIAPLATISLTGFYLIFSANRKKALCLPKLLGMVGGTFVVSTAALTMTQMAYSLSSSGFSTEATVTIALISVSLLAGSLAICQSCSGVFGTTKWKLLTSLSALIALLSWSGLLIGPAIILIASLTATEESK